MTDSSAHSWGRRPVAAVLAAALAATSVLIAPVAGIVAPSVVSAAGSFADPHFADSPVFTGLTQPTTVRFAGDGRAFVAEKRGIIKEYDSVNDSTPIQVLDIRKDVHDFWDRGLLSIALDPDFLDGSPFIYLYYDYDAPPGQSAPVWPSGQTAPAWSNSCPTPPGATTDGCVVTSKLDRYTVNLGTNVADPSSRLNLIGDGASGEWCQQFPSHAGGALAFGPDGYLYVTGGDGASFDGMDYGQLGGTLGPTTPVNPCNDPYPGQVQSTAEGGMLRSQDVRTQGDPTGLDGAIIRIDPATGNAPADNPLKDFAGADSNTKRMIATGFRNPFRMTFRPGHNDLYVGDVGNGTWEEVDRVTVPGPATPTTLPDFGWPCYEGIAQQDSFASLSTTMCNNLYAQQASQPGTVTPPLYQYTHSGTKTPKGPCFPGSADQTSSISGVAFYEGASGSAVDYPAKYDGALFFVDYSRDCLGAILPQANGIPDASKVEQIGSGIANPVDLTTGTGGDLYYVDHNGGRVMRVRYLTSPTARATATPASSIAPVTVHLDGSGSSDPNAGFTIDAWDWDLDNNGTYDQSGQTYDWHITTQGVYQVKLRVHSTSGLTDTVTITVDASNSPPEPVIDSPAACLAPGCWAVGDHIAFSGHASDDEDGGLTGDALSWEVVMEHCPAGCHEHTIVTDSGKTGSFDAPDHEYPSYLVIRLTATDNDGASTTVEVALQPKTVTVALGSSPAGVPLTIGNESNPAPWTATLIKGGSTTISAPLTQTIGGHRYRFSTWNDSHKRVRNPTLNSNRSLTATYVPDAPDSCVNATTNSPKKTTILERSSGNSDGDWFRFHVANKRTLRVTLDNAPVNLKLELRKDCTTVLDSSNKAGKASEVITKTLNPGVYEIRVTAPNDNWSASPYSLLIKPV